MKSIFLPAIIIFFSTRYALAAESAQPIQLKNLNVEEGLFVLAKNTNKDFYFDSSTVNIESRANHIFDQQDYRSRFLLWGQDHKLAIAFQNDSCLFWNEPDIDSTWKEMLMGEGLKTQEGTPTSEVFGNLLQKYLEDKPELSQKLTQPFHITEPPVELANLIAAITIAQILYENPGDYIHWYLKDDFWANALLTYNPPTNIPAQNFNIPASIKVETDPIWPFNMRTIVKSNSEFGFLNFSPLVRYRGFTTLQKKFRKLTYQRTPEGLVRTYSLELKRGMQGRQDLRLTKTSLLKKPNTIRVVETRPSLSGEDTPWQAIKNEAEIRQALIELGEDIAHADLGENARLSIIKYGVQGRLAIGIDNELPDKDVNLEARRQPLHEFLKQLEQQTGINLNLDKTDESYKLMLTARIDHKPITQVLDNLSRLYGIEWKSGEDGGRKGFLLERTDWRAKLLRFGDFTYYRMRNTWDENHNRRNEQVRKFSGQVWQKFGNEALTSPNTIRFADLPVDVQNGLRQEAESRVKYLLVGRQIRALEKLRGDLTFRIDSKKTKLGIFRNGLLLYTVSFKAPLDLKEPATQPPAQTLRPRK